jgi:outer membrane protein assembly factor BamA
MAEQGALVREGCADNTSQNEQAGESQNQKKRKRRIPEGIIFAPIPISSPAIGSGVVLAGGYIFPIRKADTVSPPSTVGGAAVLTDNGTRGLVLAGEFYFKENTYHITTVYFHGNINYNFYGVGVDAGTSSAKLPVKQTGQAFLGEFLYRVKGKLFLGPRILSGNSTITLRSETEGKVPPPPDVGIETQLTGIGFRLNRDSRLNRFYPTQGTFFDFTSMYFSEDLGSKYSFQSHRFAFNGYEGLTSKQVLAYNIYGCISGGEPPFYGECIYGANNELRGYVGGQHIDKYMIATQGEYRLALPWRLGMVAFAGLGEVAPSISQFRYDNLLPAFGGGLRLKLSKKYGVNLRADIAQGRDGHTFSMGLGEAF